jgi:uncharacterized phage infection (PIP) family protein YhgE
VFDVDNHLQAFKTAVLARKIASRYIEAMEHATDEARKKYLQGHPKADPKNHTVRHKTPQQMGRSDKKRWDSMLSATKGLKELGQKAIGGDEEATKEVGARFNAIYSGGEDIVKDATPLLRKVEKSKKGNPKVQEHADALKKALAKWDEMVPKLEKAKGRNPRAQLDHGQEALNLASEIRTHLFHLQNAAVQSGDIKARYATLA